MPRIVDNVIALRILQLLITPFKQMDAYRLGVIDDKGNLIKTGKLTSSQKDSYTLMHRIVFKLKQLLNKLPGGESQIKNVLAAYMLVRESYENEWEHLDEAKFMHIKSLLDDGVVFVEEQLLLNQFLDSLQEDGGAVAAAAPTNSVAKGGVSGLADGPVITPSMARKYKKRNQDTPILGIARRPKVKL